MRRSARCDEVGVPPDTDSEGTNLFTSNSPSHLQFKMTRSARFSDSSIFPQLLLLDCLSACISIDPYLPTYPSYPHLSHTYPHLSHTYPHLSHTYPHPSHTYPHPSRTPTLPILSTLIFPRFLLGCLSACISINPYLHTDLAYPYPSRIPTTILSAYIHPHTTTT
ncbi:hypothetical protein FIBSPDRAFT_126734 [Athelia psychrophila]|uniref:Uncharacterized protein n=1 Tax=Athelia psychrophila TaxID=1759441 RepID=A0A166T830_9AGAM|nr:hypothetical protein FIBSPDRAFT_126734 [Fibularhizoctonia sp. CBS 109695]